MYSKTSYCMFLTKIILTRLSTCQLHGPKHSSQNISKRGKTPRCWHNETKKFEKQYMLAKQELCLFS